MIRHSDDSDVSPNSLSYHTFNKMTLVQIAYIRFQQRQARRSAKELDRDRHHLSNSPHSIV
jgi:hypothetical protein